MAQDYDLVIRGGLVVDGSGGEPFEADCGDYRRPDRRAGPCLWRRRGGDRCQGPYRHAGLRRSSYPL